jgi:hypothetical protein
VTAGGDPDTTFGTAGTVMTPIGASGEIAAGQFVGIQGDGRIVVVATIMKSSGVYDVAVARYWP